MIPNDFEVSQAERLFHNDVEVFQLLILYEFDISHALIPNEVDASLGFIPNACDVSHPHCMLALHTVDVLLMCGDIGCHPCCHDYHHE